MERIYLDHGSATPIHPEVLGAMMAFHANHFGHPDSPHREGREAREAIGEARKRVAALIGALPEEIVLTGGEGSSMRLAILGTAAAAPAGRDHVVVAGGGPVLAGACRSLAGSGFSITPLSFGDSGRVDPAEVAAAVTEHTFLVSVPHADPWSGTLQPLAEISEALRCRGILLHSDVALSAGKVPLSVDELGVDLLSLTGHLFQGPKGTGAFYRRRGKGVAETACGAGLAEAVENVPGIVGLGKACEIAGRDLAAQRRHLEGLRTLLATEIEARIPGIRIHGHPSERLPNLLSVTLPGMTGEVLARSLDLRGIAVAVQPKGSEPFAGVLRFSIGRNNTAEEMRQTAAALAGLVQRHREMAQPKDEA